MKKLSLTLVSVVALFLFSCKKDSSDNNQSTGELKGKWNLENLDFNAMTSTELADSDASVKGVFLSDYISANNKGTICFDDTHITSKELSYDLTGNLNMKYYLDGALMSNVDSTLNISMPASSATTDYVRVGADSLYCPNGAFIHMETGDDLFSTPNGIKFKFDGNKLILTITQKETSTVTEDGTTQEDKIDAKLVVTLQKQ
jgi:hypothetical protein